MLRTLTLFLISAVALAGQPADAPLLPSFPPGILASALPRRSAPKTFFLPGDEILPQVASSALAGGAFFFTVFETVWAHPRAAPS